MLLNRVHWAASACCRNPCCPMPKVGRHGIWDLCRSKVWRVRCEWQSWYLTPRRSRKPMPRKECLMQRLLFLLIILGGLGLPCWGRAQTRAEISEQLSVADDLV